MCFSSPLLIADLFSKLQHTAVFDCEDIGVVFLDWTMLCSTLTDSDSFQSECANLHIQPEGMKGRILYTFPTKQRFFFKERVQL